MVLVAPRAVGAESGNCFVVVILYGDVCNERDLGSALISIVIIFVQAGRLFSEPGQFCKIIRSIRYSPVQIEVYNL